MSAIRQALLHQQNKRIYFLPGTIRPADVRDDYRHRKYEGMKKRSFTSC
jgi:hypothetical protein